MAIVYRAINTKNGKVYIGKTIKSLDHRRRAHERSADSGSEYAFHRAIRKYGAETFSWSVLDSASGKKIAQLEMLYIDMFGSFFNGYNMTVGGEGTNGYLPSAETRKKMSKAHKGNKHSLGVKMTEENRKKLSERMRGNQYTKGKPSWNKGVSCDEETKKKISESLKGHTYSRGRTMSEEAKEKIRQANLGKKLSEEHKAAISRGGKGTGTGRKSPEGRANIAAAQKKRRERERMEKELSNG